MTLDLEEECSLGPELQLSLTHVLNHASPLSMCAGQACLLYTAEINHLCSQAS